MSLQIRIRNDKVINFALAEMILINCVFVFGWMKLCYAIPIITLLLLGLYCATKQISLKYHETTSVGIGEIIVLLCASLFVAWISGVGGTFPQCFDYVMRNPIYRDLIYNEWPVVYQESGRALTYYIGYWLIPAAISKPILWIGGEYYAWEIGQLVLYLFTVANMFLLFCLIYIEIVKRGGKHVGRHIATGEVLVFCAWGGIPCVGYALFKMLHILQIETSFKIQFKTFLFNSILAEHYASSLAVINGNIMQIANVFNQSVPAWILTMLFIMLIDDISLYGIIGLSLLICGPFPIVGLGVMMLGVFAYRIITKRARLAEAISVPNMASLLMPFVLVLYFHKNIGSNFLVHIKPFFKNNSVVCIICSVIIVWFCAIGIYSIFIDSKYKDFLFYLTQILLVAFMPVAIISEIDFTMRATIPLTFYIMFLTMATLLAETKNIKAKRVIVPVLFISSYIPISLVISSIGTASEYGTFRVRYEGTNSLCNNYGTGENQFIEQYTKLLPSEDLFFSKLCGVDEKPDVPILEYDYIKDKKGNILKTYVTRAIMTEDMIDDFLSCVECDDYQKISRDVSEACKDGRYGVVKFKKGQVLCKQADVISIDNEKIGIEWTNYGKRYHNDNVPIMASVDVNYSGETPIQKRIAEKPQSESAVAVELCDTDGNLIYYPYAYTYTKNVIFQGQTKKYDIFIPKPKQNGRYILKIKFVYNVAGKMEFATEGKDYPIEIR